MSLIFVSRNFYVHRGRKIKRLFTAILLILAPACHGKGGNVIFAPSAPLLSVEFNGVSMTNPEAPPNVSDEVSDVPDYTLPSIFLSENLLCFQSLQSPFFEFERGLRVRFCRPAPASAGTQLTLDSISNGEFSALDLRTDEFEIRHLKRSDLKIYESKVGISIFGGGASGIFSDGKLKGQLHFEPLPGLFSIQMPRRIGRLYFHLLVTDEQCIFLYDRPEGGFLAVILKKSGSKIVEDSLRKLPDIIHGLRADASRGSFFASEIYFGSAERNPFLEIASPSENSASGDFQIDIGGTEYYKANLFAFPKSAILVDENTLPGFESRDDIRLHFEDAPFSFSKSEYTLSGGARARSVTFSSRLGRFLGSTQCAQSFCGTPGIHPDFASSAPDDSLACGADDFALSEINPRGFKLDGKLLSGGKFVEFRVLRSCRNSRIVFLIDEQTTLDGQSQNLEKDSFLLFTSDPSFFERPSLQADLTRLSFSSSITLLDLENGNSFPLRPKSGADYFFEDSEGKVRSLVFENGLEAFHARQSRGVRPDVDSSTSMSPGFSQEETGTEIARLSELFPRGSKNQDTSFPGDEFFEIQSEHLDGQAGLFRLMIEPQSGQKRDLRFPVMKANGYFAIFRNLPHCFPGAAATIAPAMNLPDAPARYSLFDHTGHLLSEHFINQYEYRQMDASRSSTSLIPEAGIWKISDDASSNLCSPFTNASPGLSASYRPFVLPVADDGLSRTYRFFSQEGQNQAFWKIEGPVNISFSNLLNPGESYIISPASADHSRSLISAQINGRVAHLSEFFRISPRLYIDAVESTPDAAGEEWIRVCAASDFNVPAAFRLTIRDANASDTVVPYSARFPGASWNFPETGRLNLTAGKCAIIVDPDYRGQSLPLQENDTSLWTIESTGAIGNGLGSGEGLLLSLDSQNGNEILASFGLPDSLLPFSIPSQTGQYVKRTGGTLDLPENYEVRP